MIVKPWRCFIYIPHFFRAETWEQNRHSSGKYSFLLENLQVVFNLCFWKENRYLHFSERLSLKKHIVSVRRLQLSTCTSSLSLGCKGHPYYPGWTPTLWIQTDFKGAYQLRWLLFIGFSLYSNWVRICSRHPSSSIGCFMRSKPLCTIAQTMNIKQFAFADNGILL